MHILSTGYSHTPEFNSPDAWLERIGFYTGILEELAKVQRVSSIEQIDYEGIVQRRGVDFHFIDTRKGEMRGPARLNKYISAMKPDVVLINGLIFPLQVIHLRSLLARRTKIILLHRGEIPAKGIKRGLQVFADRCADHYCFISSEIGESWVKKGIIASKEKLVEVLDASSVFSPGDQKEARRKTGVEGSPVFLWVGRLDANKDPLTVVKAFLQFSLENSGARLYMIYQEEKLISEVRSLREEHPAGQSIILVGKASKEALQSWYNSADYILSGSHAEGSGIAVIEAMSCGCIPILTDIPSFRKLTSNGECGGLYAAGSPDQLLDRLRRTGEDDRMQLRERVLLQFRTEFSFEAIAGKINRLIMPKVLESQPVET